MGYECVFQKLTRWLVTQHAPSNFNVGDFFSKIIINTDPIQTKVKEPVAVAIGCWEPSQGSKRNTYYGVLRYRKEGGKSSDRGSTSKSSYLVK